jgi:cysteinyl-tRNA synthetase
MHVGTVHVDGVKMAKSTGNLVHVRDLLSDHEGAVIRLLLLHRRWAEPWDYEPDQLDAAAGLLERIRAAAGQRSSGGRDEVLTALLDDLDVPAAVSRALERGGEAARTLLSVLRLSS